MQKVDEMVAAAQERGSSKKFREFQFLFAMVFVHECVHCWFTFVGKKEGTPPPMSIPGYGQDEDGEWVGEVGRVFEMAVYGGTVEWYPRSSTSSPVSTN